MSDAHDSSGHLTFLPVFLGNLKLLLWMACRLHLKLLKFLEEKKAGKRSAASNMIIRDISLSTLHLETGKQQHYSPGFCQVQQCTHLVCIVFILWIRKTHIFPLESSFWCLNGKQTSEWRLKNWIHFNFFREVRLDLYDWSRKCTNVAFEDWRLLAFISNRHNKTYSTYIT